MKRLASRVLPFLLIGAVVTVAVAWIRILIPPVELSAGETGADFKGATWPPGAPSDWPTPRRHEWTERFAYRDDWALADPEPDEWQYCSVHTGWPCLALAMREYWRWHDGQMSPCNGPVEKGIAYKSAVTDRALEGRLPVVPLWRGFFVDAALYAAGAWACIAPVRWFRRQRRIRRRECPSCGYPISTSPVCTECGTLVKARAGAAR